MEVGEAYTLFGQPVQVWCLDLGGTVAGDVRVPEIVRQEEYDVGLGGFLGPSSERGQGKGAKEEKNHCLLHSAFFSRKGIVELT